MLSSTLNRVGLCAGVFVGLLLTTPTALGQDGPRPGEDPSERQALLERFDADGDGTLSQEERGALRQHMQEQGQRGQRGERGDRGEGRGGSGRWGGMGGGGPMGMIARGMFRPLFMTRDLLVFVDELQLDETQTQIVEVVLEDYDAAFRMAAEEAQDAVGIMNEELRNDPDTQERMEEMRSRMREAHEEMRATRNQGQDGEAQTQISDEDRQAMREGFRARMSEIHDSFRTEMEERYSTDEVQDSLKEQRALYQRFDAALRRMNAETEEAITAILADEQQASWASAMRHIRRERMLPEGRISGESFDVQRSVRGVRESLQGEPATGVDAAVDVWMLNVDDALQRRDTFDITARFDAMEAMSARDTEGLEKVAMDRLRLQRAVRDVNDEAVETIAVAIGGEAGDSFRSEAQRDGYGRWLRQARAVRAIAAALELEDLEEELRTAIEALQVDCIAALADEDLRVLAAVRQHEEPREMRFIRRMGETSGERTEREETALDLASTRRSEVDQEYVDALKDLLGEERSAELPGMRERSRGGWGRDRGGDGGDREGMRQQFMERFDTNGDGEIDDAERQAIREAFQNRRGSGGGDGQGRGQGQGQGQSRGGEPI